MNEDQKVAQYRAALAQAFPALNLTSLEYLSEGWDSVALRVNRDLVFRFPKRETVAQSLLTEIRLLPALAPTLPLAIPQFSYIADQPGLAYPYPFVGYVALDGVGQEDWPEEERAADWWRPLFGDFLTALHAFPVPQARALGVQNYYPSEVVEPGQNWQETLENFYTAVRQNVYPLLDEARQDELADYFETFLDNDRYFQFEPVLIHADLWDDHVLLDARHHRLSVIDFGDVGIGDPALDVSELMLPYYRGKVDETFVERRRFYGGLPALISILFGQQHDSAALVEYGLNSLDEPLIGFP